MATLLKSVESKDFVGSNPTLSATPGPPRKQGPPPGLCGTCRHARVITSGRGSVFFLCRLSEVDPSFPRYPALPVLRCRGYEPDPTTRRTRRGRSGVGEGLP